MKNFFLILFLFFCNSLAIADPLTIDIFKGGLSPDAIWMPSAKILQAMQQQCLKSNSSYLECINDNMNSLGASPQAVAFNAYSHGWIKEYSQYGNVYLVYAEVPGADYSDAIYFINTQGTIINIDDWDILQTLAYEQNSEYAALESKYPKIFLSMSNHQYLQIEELSDNVQRFIFQYPLVNGCRACKVLGYASIAWDFDNKGNFVNLALLKVQTPAQGKTFLKTALKISEDKSQTILR